MHYPIHIIAGATASGKSSRALAVAHERNGVIINADATQLYAPLQILSARPLLADMQQVPHVMYGICQGDVPASVGWWVRRASEHIETAWAAGQLPIICGGTGMYIKALRDGLAPIARIDPSIRLEVEALLSDIGNEALHALLAEHDAVLAARLSPNNTQRIIRGYEVWRGTGKPMSWWQQQPHIRPFPQANISLELIELPRDELYARCDARFDAMIEQGALDEVKSLLACGYAPNLPLMKAVGVPELAAYLRDELSLEEAIILAKRNTRHYAKRQLTWLRNQH